MIQKKGYTDAMNRREFAIATGLAGAAFLGVLGAEGFSANTFDLLVRRFRLSVDRSDQTIRLTGRVPREDLVACYEALNAVSDGHLIVDGNRVTGRLSGTAFEAQILS